MSKWGEGIETLKAKAEFAKGKRMRDSDNEKIMSVAEEEARRLREGGVNFALYNYILYRVDFSKTKSWREAMYLLYETLWPFVNRLIKDNEEMKAVIVDEFGPDGHYDHLKEILHRKDPSTFAEETLNKIKGAAKKRSRANKYGVETEQKIIL